MFLPYVSSTAKKRTFQTSFYGYNHTEGCRDGEFYDMKNMSSDLYPVLSPRSKRGVYAYPDEGEFKAKAIIGKDALCYVSGNKFYINNHAVDTIDGKPPFDIDPVIGKDGEEIPIQLVSMGAYVVIFPQRLYVNTLTQEYGSLDNHFETTAPVKFTLAKPDGEAYGKLDTTAPDNPKNGDVYLDTTTTPTTVKVYSSASKSWSSVPTTYVKIECEGIGVGFEKGDGITLAGVKNEAVNELNGGHVIYDRSDNHITIIGIIGDEATAEGTEDEPITVDRKAPEMDFVVECQNRLWGCKYGEIKEGSVVNSIYASKLGDFKNWNVFSGIASDSYALSIGTDGKFTGAITYQGMPLFFKENCLHAMYGTAPSNYQMQTTVCEGVQYGSYRSMAICENVLFYKGVNGIYGFDGSLPVLVSSAFGDDDYEEAVAGSIGHKYFVSMKYRDKDKHVLFVYDVQKTLWHKEDGTYVLQYCRNGDELYFICKEDNLIHTVMDEKGSTEGRIEWSAETGIIGKDTPDKKYIEKLTARVRLNPGSRIRVYVEYDSVGGWKHLFSMDGRTLKSVSIPIRLHRCDHIRIKFEGIGEAQIHSLAKTVKEGSDR